MEVGIYLRKSRAEELADTVEETLRKHKETLLHFAQQNDLQVKKIYEEVVSGESLRARPQMLRLLEDVEAGSYDAVLCMDIDRLGRGAMSDQGVILETFKASGVRIITPRKIYDLNNELDEEYTEFETFMARRELKMIKRRMQRGVRKSIEEGAYLANAPYGYINTVVNKRPTLEINEEEARFVRIMFDLYVNQGKGCQAIADAVNAMGARPHRSDRFCRTSVMHILRNPTFTGKVVWDQKSHIRKNTRGNDKHIIVYNPREKWTVVEGLHPAIIDEGIFERAQEMFQQRYHPPSNTGTVVNPLAGLVFCARCGATMQRQAMSKGQHYLVCPHRGCTVSSRLALVESVILQYLECLLGSLRIKSKESGPDWEGQYGEILSGLEAEKKALRKQLDRQRDLLEQGIYDVDTFLERQGLLYEKEAKLELSKQLVGEKSRKASALDRRQYEKIETVLDLYKDASCMKKTSF